MFRCGGKRTVRYTISYYDLSGTRWNGLTWDVQNKRHCMLSDVCLRFFITRQPVYCSRLFKNENMNTNFDIFPGLMVELFSMTNNSKRERERKEERDCKTSVRSLCSEIWSRGIIVSRWTCEHEFLSSFADTQNWKWFIFICSSTYSQKVRNELQPTFSFRAAFYTPDPLLFWRMPSCHEFILPVKKIWY